MKKIKNKFLPYLVCLLAIITLLSQPAQAVDYWTTSYGPARAAISLQGSNHLKCQGEQYALCSHAGSADIPCTLSEDQSVAECTCYVEPQGTYYVNINAILDPEIYNKTVAVCGTSGAKCSNRSDRSSGATKPTAPVCEYINNGTFDAKANFISVFSEADSNVAFSQADSSHKGPLSCNKNLYAGCMTAPCFGQKSDDGQTTTLCQCPTFFGPYQVGAQEKGKVADQVWSAAYTPKTYGKPINCLN